MYKGGRNIKRAFWVYDASHVLFLDDDSMSMIEVDPYGKFNTDKIFDVADKAMVSYLEDTGKVYFLVKRDTFTSQGSICSELMRS